MARLFLSMTAGMLAAAAAGSTARACENGPAASPVIASASRTIVDGAGAFLIISRPEPSAKERTLRSYLQLGNAVHLDCRLFEADRKSETAQ